METTLMESLVPKIGEKLTDEQVRLYKAVAKSCRHTIISMLKQSQSGHPGGSLSSIDYMTLLYSAIISQTGEKVVISHGHISPAAYSILAEMGLFNKDEVIKTFRKLGSVFEGHVTRHVKGIEYGTGPLGIGVSIGSAFAHAEKLNGTNNKVFTLMGDGEMQEGQFYEMLNYASKYNLNNLILFVDYNKVQLTASLEEVMPLHIPQIFKAAGWNVIETDGHDFPKMWEALSKAHEIISGPTVIIGETVMGKGVSLMENDGLNKKSTWHGNAPKPDDADIAIKELELSSEEKDALDQLKKIVKWEPKIPEFVESLTPLAIRTGEPRLYEPQDSIDSRTAYGQALLDLAKENQNILAISADLRGSVMTKFVASELSKQHLEVGIAEQHMVSLAGGLSLCGFIPFASTFGAFMSSRAKDQARVNDINMANVKMVATHCGLSVGEDGPTHQAIDDMTSFLGMFNTMVIEPADANQCDRIIRFIASHYGNFYVRMGRHKYPIITKEDGSPFYGTDYKYEYGKSDVIREGNDLTIVASGAVTYEAFKALEKIKENHPHLSIELVAVTSIKQFDQTLENSIIKTRKVVTIEDHNIISGLSSQLAHYILKKEIQVDTFTNLGVKEYQLSGKSQDLYEKVNISADAIYQTCLNILHK
jgi:transketolase